MARTYLVRGMLAGLFAGLCALGFAKLGAEPQIKRAERFELQLDLQLRRAAPRPLVSRQVQDTVGLGTGIAVAGVVALVVLSYVVTPGVDEVPAVFPATLLWKFRMASIGTQAVLWGTLGVPFGALTERHESSRPRRPDGSSPPRAHDEVVEKVMVAPGATSSRALRSSSDG